MRRFDEKRHAKMVKQSGVCCTRWSELSRMYRMDVRFGNAKRKTEVNTSLDCPTEASVLAPLA